MAGPDRTSRVIAVLTAAWLALPAVARADDEPPAVRKRPAPPAATRDGSPVQADGEQALRPLLGVAGHLDVDVATPAGGNKILFGLDYQMGGPTGFALALGMHLGAGGRAFLLHPILELHYRFGLPIPLVPYVGAGVGVRLAFARGSSANIAIGFRFVAGVEYYLTPHVALTTQVALPDIGPRLTPDIRPVGTLEWTFGPAFRF